ncbi:M1 family aminopeptidase [bacterium]|nr:M1 family aminopeptidase [bacterium]
MKDSDDLWLDYWGQEVQTVLVNDQEVLYSFENDRIYLKALKKGLCNIEVSFISKFTNMGVGIHHYFDENTKEDFYYSNLCPYDAHRVFPCFDQPDLKAIFDLKLRCLAQYNVVANYPQRSKEIFGDYQEVEFEQSQKFSTYLFNVSFGDYQKIVCKSSKVPMSLLYRKEKESHVDHERIFHLIDQAMGFYEDFFSCDFPFPKYDQIFVPEFNWGAMENIGAVVIREEMLFEEVPKESQRFSRANTLVHELAHMWFGNLVTMKWWDDLWLNESFATYMAYLCLESTGLYPDSFEYFSEEVKQGAMFEDALSTTHPVVVNCKDTDGAFLNFDAITYLKGASILKQLVFFIGEQGFKDGLANYFSKYSFQNTCLQDFLGEFDMDLKDFSKSWLETCGTNSIEIKKSSKGFKLIQNFGGDLETRPRKLKFCSFSSQEGFSSGKKETLFVTEKETELEVEHKDFFYSNVDDYDYVRTFLDPESVDYLVSNLPKIEDSTFAIQLHNSLFQMTLDKKMKTAKYYELVMNLIEEAKHSKLLISALSNLSQLISWGLYEEKKESLRSVLLKKLDVQEVDFRRVVFATLLQVSQDKDFSELWSLKSLEWLSKSDLRNLYFKLCKSDYSSEIITLCSEDLSDSGKQFFGKLKMKWDPDKEKSWNYIIDDNGISDYIKGEAMGGFFQKNEETKKFLPRYFKYVLKIMEEKGNIYQKRYFSSLFPDEFIQESLNHCENLLENKYLHSSVNRHLSRWRDLLALRQNLLN